MGRKVRAGPRPRDLRFPLGPLLAASGDPTLIALQRRLGPDVNVARLKRDGLTVWAADRYAIRLGLHPVLVWDDWGADLLEDGVA